MHLIYHRQAIPLLLHVSLADTFQSFTEPPQVGMASSAAASTGGAPTGPDAWRCVAQPAPTKYNKGWVLRASVRVRKSSPSCVQRRTHNDGVWEGLGEQRVWSSSQEAGAARSMRYWRYLCRCDLDIGLALMQTVVRAPRSTPLTTWALPVGRRRAVPSPAGKLSFEFGTDGRCNNGGARTTGMQWVKKPTKRESKLGEYRRKRGVKAV